MEHQPFLFPPATPMDDSDTETENNVNPKVEDVELIVGLSVDENVACQEPGNDPQQTEIVQKGHEADAVQNYDVLRREIAEDEASEDEEHPPEKIELARHEGGAAQVTSAEALEDNHVSEPGSEHMIELGLTQGNQRTVARLRSDSLVLRRTKTDAVFELMESLDFYPSQSKLADFLRNRLVKAKDIKMADKIKPMCDLENPDDIYRALLAASANTKVAKIYRVYGQIRLAKAIHELASEEVIINPGISKLMTHTWHLKQVAARSAGDVSDAEKGPKIKHFEEEFYAGRRWIRINRWFGGIGFVIIVVTSGQLAQLLNCKADIHG